MAGGVSVFDISAYIPDSILPQFEAFREGLVSLLQTLGIVKGETKTDSGAGKTSFITRLRWVFDTLFVDVDTSKARQALTDAERELSKAQSDVSTGRNDLSRLFDPAWYGKEGEFKKLDGTCLEKDTGESVSFLQRALSSTVNF